MSRFDKFFIGCIIGILAAKTFIILLEDIPSAIDVYRGKTTLEITYIDSVAVDSVVV